jgi:hypothetical protein
MKTWLIVGGAVVLIIVILVVAFSGSGGAAPKDQAPKSPPASSTGSAVPDVADAIQVQLDARVKAGLAVTLASQRNDLKQLLAMEPIDAEAAKNQLKACDDLAAEVDAGRAELVTRGMPAKDFDAWLVRNHWDEVQADTKTLREKAAQGQ